MFDVGVIGVGRVGLPLLLAFANKGLKVCAIDSNVATLDAIMAKKMPFEEKDCQEVLEQVDPIPCFKPVDLPSCKFYFITVGTPLRQHIETDLSQINKVIDNLIDSGKLEYDTIIVLRSTIAPRTTEYIKKKFEKYGIKSKVVMCPERIAEGVAWKELHSLPQIIGVDDKETEVKVKKLFKTLNQDLQLFVVKPHEAELAKLFCNIYRYISFSIPNYFMYLMKHFGVEDCDYLMHAIKENYPRMKEFASPGFVAGPCLVKDFGMINEWFPHTDLLLQAHKINEFMPNFLVESRDLENKDVIVLGYTFKKNSDDIRDSLVPKLIRYIERKNPKEIFIHDPFLPYGSYYDIYTGLEIYNYTKEEIVDIVKKNEFNTSKSVTFIGTNHDVFYGPIYQVLFSMNSDVVDI